MTVAFTCFLSILLSETVGPELGYLLLPSLVLVGLSSVLYWHAVDDLTPYAVVQGFPLIVAPFLLLAFEPKYTHNECYLVGLLFYALAKATEKYDAEIYRATRRTMSGHTMKHLLAAGATICFYVQVAVREKID